MPFVDKMKKNGTTYDIHDKRVPNPSVEDEGKAVVVDENGNFALGEAASGSGDGPRVFRPDVADITRLSSDFVGDLILGDIVIVELLSWTVVFDDGPYILSCLNSIPDDEDVTGTYIMTVQYDDDGEDGWVFNEHLGIQTHYIDTPTIWRIELNQNNYINEYFLGKPLKSGLSSFNLSGDFIINMNDNGDEDQNIYYYINADNLYCFHLVEDIDDTGYGQRGIYYKCDIPDVNYNEYDDYEAHGILGTLFLSFYVQPDEEQHVGLGGVKFISASNGGGGSGGIPTISSEDFGDENNTTKITNASLKQTILDGLDHFIMNGDLFNTFKNYGDEGQVWDVYSDNYCFTLQQDTPDNGYGSRLLIYSATLYEDGGTCFSQINGTAWIMLGYDGSDLKVYDVKFFVWPSRNNN